MTNFCLLRSHWPFVSSLSGRRLDKKDLYWYWRERERESSWSSRDRKQDGFNYTTHIVVALWSRPAFCSAVRCFLVKQASLSVIRRNTAALPSLLSTSQWNDLSMSARTEWSNLSEREHSLTNLFFNSVTPLVDLKALYMLSLPVDEGHFLVPLAGTSLSGSHQ